MTVSNSGGVTGYNIVVSDTLNAGLSIDSVDAPGASVSISGQTVTVTIPQLDPGQTYQFSIFTTVTSGTDISNTACITGYGDCATAQVVRALPSTGEVPEN